MDPKPPTHTGNLLVFAPNWLGDAVMALPAIADVRRATAGVLAVAARAAVAPLFQLAGGVDEVIVIERGSWRQRERAIPPDRFGAALLLPNSLQAAILARRSGIGERWGYRTDCRGALLTRAVDRAGGLHQVDAYRHLVDALGFQNGDREPRITVPADRRSAASALLQQRGWNGQAPLVAIAPGAAYGGAKRWQPESFAALAAELIGDGIDVVMIGTHADRDAANEVARRFEPRGRGAWQAGGAIRDLVGATDLPTLAGVLALSRALVTNDSGAMHLAAAAGTPVTAVFGPTDERATRPIGRPHTVIVGEAWCRPCMLRECPIDHRCMRSIGVAPVAAAALRSLSAS
jgi:heptosyltransferase II